MILYAVEKRRGKIEGKRGDSMAEKYQGQKWLAWAVPAALSLIVIFVPFADSVRSALVIPVIVLQLLLPVIVSMTGALCPWPVTTALCVLSAAFGWKVLPIEAMPAVLFWCAACGATACLRLKRPVTRPVLRTLMCLAVWCIGMITLLQLTGGNVVKGLAQAACDYVDRSPDSTELLLRAYSAGYVRLSGTEAFMTASRYMGGILIPESTRTQMLYTLRVSLESILPSALCSAVVYHTAITVLLSTVLPDWLRRRKGERGEFPPMEQWYMPRRMGAAVFALCIGWVVALLAEDGIGAYLGWMCADVFRVAFVIQGICWMQWMGKRMGLRSAARNLWSVVLGIVLPLIPMIMGMIDQRRDARHLRPKEEADQE